MSPPSAQQGPDEGGNHSHDDHGNDSFPQPQHTGSSGVEAGEGHHHHHQHGEPLDVHSLSLAYQTFLRHDHEETTHFESVCESMRLYARFAMAQRANLLRRVAKLPPSEQRVLPAALIDAEASALRHAAYKEATIRNQFCLDCILRHAGVPHSQQQRRQLQTSSTSGAPSVSVSDQSLSKVSSVLKSLTRDWSAEGRTERDSAYGPILRYLRQYVPVLIPVNDALGSDTSGQHRRIRRSKVCVPGSGLARLAWELVRCGYCVQGNEFSLHMLLSSDFILNGGIATPDHPLRLAPWLLETRNVRSHDAACRTVIIPDVDPMGILNGTDSESGGIQNVIYDTQSTVPDRVASIGHGQQHANPSLPPEFSMAAGDFTSIYDRPEESDQWDAVASCFFLDACPDVVAVIQLIFRMLRPGGVLVNLGPLLYHWSGPAMHPVQDTTDDNGEAYAQRFRHLDSRYLTSIDLTYEDLREVMVNIGFEIIEEEEGIECHYTADTESLMNMTYRCVSFVARKPVGHGTHEGRNLSDAS